MKNFVLQQIENQINKVILVRRVKDSPKIKNRQKIKR